MDALRNVHEALVPEGELVDLHPVAPPESLVLAGGVPLGRVDERKFIVVLQETEGALDGLVGEGLFRPEEQTDLDFRERWLDAEELLEHLDEDEFVDVPRALRGRVLATEPPFEVVMRVVLRRYRAV